MVAAMGDGKGAVPSAYYINKDEALYQFPMLNGEGLKGACARVLPPCQSLARS